MALPNRSLVFVGRDATMRVLTAELDKAVGGHGSTLIVAGEAGSGKTRVTLELETLARARGIRTFRGTCFQEDRSVPSAWVSDMLRQLAWQAGDAERVLAEVAPLFVSQVPDLRRLMRAGGAAELSELPIGQRLVYLLRLFLGSGPVLVIAEDLHWSDASGIEAFLSIARVTPPSALLAVGTYRTEELGPDLDSALATLERERLVRDVPIQALSPGNVELMVRTMLAPTSVDPLMLGRLQTLTEGNPFFIEEIVRQLARPTAARLELSDLDRVPVPRAIRVTVRRGMNYLSDGARRIVEAASVIGQRFSAALLARVLAISDADTVAALSEALASGLVVELAADQFAFRHALTREAVYEVVLGWERRRLHRLIAEDLDRSGADDPTTRTARSDHWFQAEVWDRALDTALVAASTALELSAPGAAAELFDRAEAAAQHVGSDLPLVLLTGRGRALEMLGEFDRSRVDLECAAVVATDAADPGLICSTQFDLGWLWSARDYRRAGIHFRAALDAARRTGNPSDTARALNRVGNWHLTSEEPIAALELHKQALDMFARDNDQRGTAQSLDLIGTAKLTLGDMAGAIESYLAAVDCFRAFGDKQGIASSLAMLTFCGPQYLTGPVGAHVTPLSDRLGWGREALELTESINWRSGQALAMLGLANVLGFHGQYRHALAHATDALALADELDHRYWRTLAHLVLGAIDLDVLALERGAERLSAGLDLARAIGSDYWARIIAGLLVPTLLTLGREKAARGITDAPGMAAVARSSDARGLSMGQRYVLMARAELALHDGAPRAGLDIVDALESPTVSTAFALGDLRGRLLEALGRGDEARSVWSLALSVAREANVKPRIWRFEAHLARSLRAAGHRGRAAEHLGRAWTMLEELAAAVPEGESSSFLRAARAAVPASTDRERRKERFDGLTDREREVAAHAARGMTNAEIARVLSVSSRTVEKHLEHAMGKLGVTSRVQLAGWVLRKDT